MGIADNFKGIPIEELISAPLLACCQAQMKIARETLSFIKLLTKEDGSPYTLDFLINKSVTTDSGELQNISSKIRAPILGLIPVPSLLVESVEIEFNIEVNSTAISEDKLELTEEETTNSSKKNNKKQDKKQDKKQLIEPDLKDWLSEETLEMHGTLSSLSKETRSTDNSAKYRVKVIAKQHPVPEGMARILDMMAQGVGSQ
jgi:hypothetical protein